MSCFSQSMIVTAFHVFSDLILRENDLGSGAIGPFLVVDLNPRCPCHGSEYDAQGSVLKG